MEWEYLRVDEVRKKKVFLSTPNDSTVIMNRKEFMNMVRGFKTLVDNSSIINSVFCPNWCLGYYGLDLVWIELGKKYCFVRFGLYLSDLKKLGESLSDEFDRQK